MQINTIKRENPNKKARLIGRGGTRGKTSGRGMKGQTSRAGNKRRPQMRDIIKKLPKLRGYRFNSHKANKFSVVNVNELNIFEEGAIVKSETLFEKKLVRRVGGVYPKVKILGNGEIKIKVSVEKCLVSETARKKIEKVGGNIK